MGRYDIIIIGSGAGGCAAAYHLTQTGARVLLLEKGEALPRDGSTLDPERVMGKGEFLSREPWRDGEGREILPEEHFNLGGKTKWYGAALLRFDPTEFAEDPARRCLAWPIAYADLAPFYEEAERLLAVQTFPPEPDITRLAAGLARRDAGWQSQGLALGLSPDILTQPREASHFDGFASVLGLKADAEQALLGRIAHMPNLALRTGCPVRRLLGDGRRVTGVECADGSSHHAGTVVLAAGALHSPRLLQDYLAESGLDRELPGSNLVGRHYKSHILTALLAFSSRPVTDVLGKTLLLLHRDSPASSVQTLGGSLGADIASRQMPGFVPGWIRSGVACRAYGFFLQTEDGSHPDNRVLAAHGGRPQLDYNAARLPGALGEHTRLVAKLRRDLLGLGYVAFSQRIGVTGTAHACGTLVTGARPETSVVDPEGRVWGLENLYVADGSVLPRSSRVNPALTIYAWGLRIASLLAGHREHAHGA